LNAKLLIRYEDREYQNPFFLDIGGILLTNGWGREERQAAIQKFGLDKEELKTAMH